MKKSTKIVVLFLIAVVILVFFTMPTGYYIKRAGQTQSVDDIVKISGHKKNKYDNFVMTNVSLSEATPIQLFLSLHDQNSAILSKDDILGNNSVRDYEKNHNFYLSYVKNSSKKVAFKAVDKKVKQEYVGEYVFDVIKSSDFSGKLKTGDVVTKVNGVHFLNHDEFRRYISSLRKNKKITLGYVRNKKYSTVKGKVIELDKVNKSGLGIVSDSFEVVKTKPKVKYSIGKNQGDATSGITLALQMYYEMSGKKVTYKKITGIGVMHANGAIEPVDSVQQRIVSAVKNDVKIVFVAKSEVPDKLKSKSQKSQDNYNIAKKTADSLDSNIKIIQVKNFNEIIKYLNTHS